jgi:toxin FitB
VEDGHLFLSVMTLGEIRKGFVTTRDLVRRAFLERWFEDELLPWFEGRILPVTDAIAQTWGELDGQCQLRGAPLNTADGLIAATALQHGLTLATRNVKDFADLDVQIFNPWQNEGGIAQ